MQTERWDINQFGGKVCQCERERLREIEGEKERGGIKTYLKQKCLCEREIKRERKREVQ